MSATARKDWLLYGRLARPGRRHRRDMPVLSRRAAVLDAVGILLARLSRDRADARLVLARLAPASPSVRCRGAPPVSSWACCRSTSCSRPISTIGRSTCSSSIVGRISCCITPAPSSSRSAWPARPCAPACRKLSCPFSTPSRWRRLVDVPAAPGCRAAPLRRSSVFLAAAGHPHPRDAGCQSLRADELDHGGQRRDVLVAGAGQPAQAAGPAFAPDARPR